MADDPNVQPAGTEWVVVKHERLPFPQDVVIGTYPTAEDALSGLNAAMQNKQWFCSYSIEHRNKGG